MPRSASRSLSTPKRDPRIELIGDTLSVESNVYLDARLAGGDLHELLVKLEGDGYVRGGCRRCWIELANLEAGVRTWLQAPSTWAAF